MSTPSLALPVPGVVHGVYPQRAGAAAGKAGRRRGPFASSWAWGGVTRERARRRLVDAVRIELIDAPSATSPEFTAWVAQVRRAIAREGLRGQALVGALACAAQACADTLGMMPFDTQIRAAAVMLDDRLAEMATGEGKTIAALLAAAAAALAGIPVHLLTANDYLAARDAKSLASVYQRLGLEVACARPGQSSAERRATYRADVVYGTAREFIFDYLRDRLAGVSVGSSVRSRLGAIARRAPGRTALAGPGPLMRGLCFALIDEADSVLIDEARTPFVLAEAARDDEKLQANRAALALARTLHREFDFTVSAAGRAVELTEVGRHRVRVEWQDVPERWRHHRIAVNLVESALAALHLYRRDVDYVVRAGKVEIVDATTGRVAEGRQWSQGLHQLIELKERCQPTPAQRTVAQLSFQAFFPRYLKLGGMSGTLLESRTELSRVYGLPVEPVPLHQPSRRECRGTRVYIGARQRWRAVIVSIRRCQARGQPVLVGTDSVADSIALSRRLARLGIGHRVLHARQDEAEAEVVADAGAAGAVTVATNMAGRGTDIRLDVAARQAGGLHVICCQQNASLRIDRQLWGRAARQGDPGSYETLLSVTGGLLARRLPGAVRESITRLAASDGELPGPLARALVAWTRRLEDGHARRQREQLLKLDEHLGERLSFAGTTP